MRFLLICILALSAAPASAADVSRSLWHDTLARTLSADAPPVSAYRMLSLDLDAARARLAQTRHGAGVVTLALPRPDGGFGDFTLADSRTMPDALQDNYPDIISLVGKDGDGRMARVDISPQGLQAMVFDTDGIWVVRPESLTSNSQYLSFRRADLALSATGFQCDVPGGAPSLTQNLASIAAPMTTTGAKQRVYRAAVAANHNYVAAVCPGNVTVACGLANVVTAMNRVNQVYETELGVHMTLIANDNLIIYPSASGDPYSNTTSALNQNISNLASVIGNANFDIGHVFTTGSGGLAGLGVTCTSSKAGGTTGLPTPTGDAFYIDYVAHEMGHQFGGNHTFNSTTDNCGGGNRAATAAYEPGSGSTIMAYAGICAADNLQLHSDPYFHAKSLDEITTWINGTGGSCAISTTSTDHAPVIDTASIANGLTIPMQTPFALSASASDADGDTMSYNWEQYDLGSPTTLAQGDIGNGPIFRSFNATASATRVFPKMSTVLGAAFVPGETWPKTTRNLDFRLTVRDNHGVPGTPQYGASSSADTVIHVTSAAGPFTVTAPLGGATWQAANTQNVAWNVANTTAAPVSCAAVDVLYSADGGATFPIVLASAIPNSGSATLTVPNLPATTTARIEVRCSNSIFFNVSPGNFNMQVRDAIFADGFEVLDRIFANGFEP
ncbi:MAG: hypothetical protein JSR27_08590 [Proteobacteria bacterium]|nr:hypothetical protein [Pseudomonadota bacterium]